MEYSAYAKKKFEEICAAAPANCCTVTDKGETVALDMGAQSAGGWTSVKLMLDALMGGRGIVNISREFRGMHQFPAVELMYDDPVGAYEMAFAGEGACGIKDGDAYAFGVSDGMCPNCAARAGKGNVAIVGKKSLAYAALDSARAVPDAVKLLLDNGIKAEDIQWAWSFSPIGTLSLDEEVLAANMAAAKDKRVVSIWLRGDDEALAKIVGQFAHGTLRLHNLVTARTIMVEGPAKAVNA